MPRSGRSMLIASVAIARSAIAVGAIGAIGAVGAIGAIGAIGALSGAAGCSGAASPQPDVRPPDRGVDAPKADLVTDGAGSEGRSDAAGAEGGTVEAGLPCPAAFASCSSFIDATAPTASRMIVYRDFAYDPPCLRVRAGQSVTFDGVTDADDFLRHPLVQSCGPQGDVLVAKQGKTTSITLSTAGVYGYYCLDHGNAVGQVMSGAIEVVP